LSQNVDLVRSIYAAWGTGVFRATGWADPEIDFEIVDGPDPGHWHGMAGMAEGWQGWLAAWDGYVAEADEFRELDGGRVLVFGRMSGRGKTSGVNVDTAFVNLFAVRDSKVTKLVLYSSSERALADLGLTE
jgi:SnoaL-like domain